MFSNSRQRFEKCKVRRFSAFRIDESSQIDSIGFEDEDIWGV